MSGRIIVVAAMQASRRQMESASARLWLQQSRDPLEICFEIRFQSASRSASRSAAACLEIASADGGGEIDCAVLRLEGKDDGVELSPLVKGGDVGDAISILGDGGQVSLSVARARRLDEEHGEATKVARVAVNLAIDVELHATREAQLAVPW